LEREAAEMSHFVDRKVLGVLLALASYAMYTLHYATMKWLDESYSLWQLIFARSAVMLVITLVVGRQATIRVFLASPYKLSTALRGVLHFLSALGFFVAAGFMPLADVTTLYSTSPLIGVLLSAILLGERIRGLHWIAVLLGLVGAVIAANPGGDVSLIPSLIVLGAGLLWALTVVLTRKSGARESSNVQLFSTGIVFLLLSAGFMQWQPPQTLFDSALILALGLQIYLAQLFFFEACRFAPASLVGPMEYSSVIWACLFGVLIFSEMPALRIVLGGLLIIVSGVALAVSLRKVSNVKHGSVLTRAEGSRIAKIV
jgi:drug/metabolite transporter (DMT)-like permease